VGGLKETKISSPLSSLMTTCMLPIAPSHGRRERRGRGERREREREIGTLILF
jgi:hypothetical protein